MQHKYGTIMTQRNELNTATNRRYDIDWVRVLVFDLLILYHVGMFFVPWGWHIKNIELVAWVQYPMLFLNQWRLPILFVVSGMGTRFALSNKTGGQYMAERFKRLFVPLVVGMLLIVPPQVYVERLASGDTTLGYVQYYPQTFTTGIYPQGNLSWHHLWFLPYLLLMSIIAAPLFLRLRKPGNRVVAWLQGLVQKASLSLYLLTLPLMAAEAFLEPLFPPTRALVGDWYALVHFFLLFVAGFLFVAIKDAFWPALQRTLTVNLAVGLLCFGGLLYVLITGQLEVLKPLFKTLNMWAWVLVVLGLSARYLNRPSRVIAYRNQAVYPFYIVHQTITILLGYWLMHHPMHYGLKMAIMVVGTFGVSWLLYEGVICRVPFLRPLFGLKKKAKAAADAA